MAIPDAEHAIVTREKVCDMLVEHSIVVLTRDLLDVGLRAGDVGTIVHIDNAGAAYEVEFVAGEGATVALVTLDAPDVRPRAAGELLHTRRHNQTHT